MARRKRQTRQSVAREINPQTGRTDLKTGFYEPIRHHVYWQHPRDLPLFNFDIIRLMLWDPAVLIALRMRSAPLASVELGYEQAEQWIPGIEAQKPEVGQFVHRQLMKLWQNHIDEIAASQIWGWSAGEVSLKLSPNKLVEVARLEPRQARDCRVLTRDGTPCGIEVRRVTNEGAVELEFPKCWFHNHDPEPGEYYGKSALLGAYSAWADKWLDGGALDVRRLFMHKDAYGGSDLGYPEGSTLIGEVDVPNRDIARQIVEQLQAGGVTTRPSTRDENGNEKWPLQRATVPSNPMHILEYPKDLDAEIRRGVGVPDDIIDNDGGGAWAGKRIPLAAFYASLDSWVRRIITDLNEQIIEPLVVLNWGSLQEYEIRHKPLAKQAMEQQSNAGPGEEEQQGDDMFGGGGPPRMPQQQQSPPGQRMSLDPVQAVGEGVLSAAELVKAARHVIRMDSKKNRWITVKPNGEDEPGRPVMIDGEGKVVAGAGGALDGKKLTPDSKESKGPAPSEKSEKPPSAPEKLLTNQSKDDNLPVSDEDSNSQTQGKTMENVYQDGDYKIEVSPISENGEARVQISSGKQKQSHSINKYSSVGDIPAPILAKLKSAGVKNETHAWLSGQIIRRAAVPMIQQHLDAIANEEGQKKEKIESELKSGKTKFNPSYYGGEVLSGFQVSGEQGKLLKELGLAKDVDGWGTLVDQKVIDSLGESFTYEQAQEFAQPALDAKEAKKNEAKAKRDAVFAKAKKTGEKQLLAKNTEMVDEEENSLNIVYTYAMPDGTTKTETVRTY